MAIKKATINVNDRVQEVLARRRWTMKGRSLLMQNPIFARLSLHRSVSQRLAGLQALRALHAQGLKGAQLAAALAQLGEKMGFLKGQEEVAHFRDDWLGRWFPQSPSAEIFLAGFLQAAEVALADPENALPMHVYWAASQNSLVHAAVARSPHQVTLLIMTPSPAVPVRVRTLTKRDPIWTVSGTRKVVVEQAFMTGLNIGPAGRSRAKGARAPKPAAGGKPTQRRNTRG